MSTIEVLKKNKCAAIGFVAGYGVAYLAVRRIYEGPNREAVILGFFGALVGAIMGNTLDNKRIKK